MRLALSDKRAGSHSGAAPVSNAVAVTGMCIVLLLVVWIAFGQSIHHDFVNYDDDRYVYDNATVTAGLTLHGVESAFTHFQVGNWHPLTLISHMLDCELYGLAPWGHHLTNIILHAAAAVLLFLALRRLTLSLWPSAFVAALFAIHPLRVESVAWVAERKDVLSGIFFAVTLLAYAGYARRQQFSLAWYSTVIILFALGLMCKPTLVTLPFVLLLLDYWPLGRIQTKEGRGQRSAVSGSQGANFTAGGRERLANRPREAGDSVLVKTEVSVGRSLVVEKIPLLILSAASCVITALAQREAFAAIQGLPLRERVANAAVSYFAYLSQTIYPTRLAVLYPYPEGHIPILQAVAAGLCLLILSTAVFLSRARYPYLLTGWFWFLGMLVPMIGLVQVGPQAHADRYTYLPGIGLCIMATWGAMELRAKWGVRREMLGTAAVLMIAALTTRSYFQASCWQNGETLWTHTIKITSVNYIAHNNFANWLLQRGRLEEAIAESRSALAINADLEEAHITLGNCLLRKGDSDGAVREYRVVLQFRPEFAEVRCNLGSLLLQKGQVNDAIAQYEKVLEVSPNFAEAHYNLGNAFLQKQQVNEAITHYRKALEIKPDYAEAHNNLGIALAQKGELDLALSHFKKAIQIKPDYAQAYNDMGTAFIRKGQVDQAINCYEKAVQIKSDYVDAYNNLGVTLVQEGETEKGISYYKKALAITPDSAEIEYNLANALAGQGDWADSIPFYRAALRSQPDRATAYNNLGVSLDMTGKIDEALGQFIEALRLNENYPEAHCNLARVLARLGRRDEAIAHLNTALRLRPDYADAKEQLRELGVTVGQ
jgi:tetratricopeptide (TPR) repeat protein